MSTVVSGIDIIEIYQAASALKRRKMNGTVVDALIPPLTPNEHQRNSVLRSCPQTRYQFIQSQVRQSPV